MRILQYLKKEVIVLSILIGAVVCILFSSPVFSDQVITIEDTGNSFPLYDSVQYQIQDTIQKEETEGRRLFISVLLDTLNAQKTSGQSFHPEDIHRQGSQR
jgi:hypothetical protein